MDAKPFQRAAFWTFYVLGTMTLIFSSLLAQVPAPRGTNLTLDYTVWSSSSALLLACIFMARGRWKTMNPIGEGSLGIAARTVLAAVWLELAFCLHGILSLATYN
jgi:hypothetical protein